MFKKPEIFAPPEIKKRVRELAAEYARADRNRCHNDAMKIIDTIRHLGYDVFAEIPGVLRCRYTGGINVQVRGM